MTMVVTISESAIAELEKLPLLIKFKGTDACLSAVAKPVARRAKMLAPSSRQPTTKNPKGSRAKWSRKYSENPGWADVDSGKHIGYRVRRYSHGGVVFVGGIHPQANKLQFNNPESREHKFWGNSRTGIYRPPFRLFQRAADETRSEQETAFLAALEKVLEAS